MGALRRRDGHEGALQRYSAGLGRLAERRMLDAALTGARRDAEREAFEAKLARREIEAVAASLREEIEARLGTQSRLAYLASHDPLTALPNRALLAERLLAAAGAAHGGGHRLALHYLDLDNFKDVNDSFGHAVGDVLLRQVAERIAGELRDGDTVARLGGDEFAVLQAETPDRSAARALAERIIARIGEPFLIEGRALFVGASVGVTVFPDDDPAWATEPPDTAALHRSADLAMYQAKGEGGNRCRFFDDTLSRRAHRRATLEHALREPALFGQLQVLFQPQVDMRDGAAVGVEALLRWNHPSYGAVSPEEFIPLAEASGLICGIGTWVLRESCRQAAAWRAAGLARFSVAVNVSTAQIRDGRLQQLVADTLAEFGLPAAWLELEITESGIMRNTHAAAETLADLHRQGVGLSIDDFGTGYSSLSYLRRLPVDRIKIDRSFVADVITSEDAAVLAATIVRLAPSLRLQVVAEGVETQAQADFIAATGCDYAQGYHYSLPLDAGEAERYLRGAALRRATTRIFGFEIMPAPFVIAHLQIAMLLAREDINTPLADSQRAQVFLTNALTGWVPVRHPQSVFGFSALVEERDAAEAIKQADTILVIFGNPPYNGYAGIAQIEEERNLTTAYRTPVPGLPAPQGQGLNDLYVRFFRIAERSIVGDGQARGNAQDRGLIYF